MKKLDLLASLDEGFVLLQNEGKSMEVYQTGLEYVLFLLLIDAL
jgi:hypothetical protein